MKKRSIGKLIFLTLTIGLVLVSCKNDRTREEKVSAIINEIGSPFIIVNTIPGDLIDKSGAMDGALPFTQEMLLNFFIDESVTGVDYKTDMQIVATKGPSFAPNFYAIFKLKNESAFKDLLEIEANGEVKEKDGFSYVLKESDQYTVVWNEEFVIAANIPIDFEAMMSGGSSDGMVTIDKSIALINAANDGEINEEYKTFLQNESDIALHFSGKGFYGYMMEMSMGEVDELEANREAIEGINTDLFLNFNDGSIDLQFLNELSDKLKEDMVFLKDTPIKSSLLSYGDSKNPLMTMVYNADVEKALDNFKKQLPPNDYDNFEEEINNMGMTVDEAKTTLTGDILIVVDRVEVKEVEVDWGYGAYMDSELTPIFAVVVSIGNKTALTKLFADSELITDGVVKSGDAYLVMKDDVLFSTNDSLWAIKVATGNTETIQDKAGIISTSPFGIFVDMLAVAKMGDLDGAEVVVNMLKDMRASGNMNEVNISFTFKDASKNSLRIITETLSNMTDNGGMSDQDYNTLQSELEDAVIEGGLEEGMEELEDAMEALEVLEEAL